MPDFRQEAQFVKGELFSSWIETAGAIAGVILVPNGWPVADIAFLVSSSVPEMGAAGDFLACYDDLGALVRVSGVPEAGGCVPIPRQALVAGYLRLVAVDPKTEEVLPAADGCILTVVVRP